MKKTLLILSLLTLGATTLANQEQPSRDEVRSKVESNREREKPAIEIEEADQDKANEIKEEVKKRRGQGGEETSGEA